jgi:hypothetical protein
MFYDNVGVYNNFGGIVLAAEGGWSDQMSE